MIFDHSPARPTESKVFLKSVKVQCNLADNTCRIKTLLTVDCFLQIRLG